MLLVAAVTENSAVDQHMGRPGVLSLPGARGLGG